MNMQIFLIQELFSFQHESSMLYIFLKNIVIITIYTLIMSSLSWKKISNYVDHVDGIVENGWQSVEYQ